MTPLAYYNEIDSYAAEWLGNLILAGHIAPGIVDTRSIEDVTPNDLRGFTQCHFFAGIGVWSYALRLAGWPDHRQVWTASCPCQPFSTAGQLGGVGDTDGGLSGWRLAEALGAQDQSGSVAQPGNYRPLDASPSMVAGGRSDAAHHPWRDADWLFCRDGRWRPVEPGTFPLAHGAPARVGRLRAYGNAVNAAAAQAWIECVM